MLGHAERPRHAPNVVVTTPTSPAPHPFANSSPLPTQRRASALPSSTSESHLARTARTPPQPKPPAQPTKVRPFILRGSSAPSRTAEGRDPEVAAAGKAKDVSEDAAGSLRKSKTSVEITQQAASARSNEPDKVDKERRRRTVAVRGDLGMTPKRRPDGAGSPTTSRRGGLSRSPPTPSSSAPPRRPLSLATSSLRTISSSCPSSSSSSHATPSPRRRPLSYVSSNPTSPPSTTSPPRRRPNSFSASPSPPAKGRPSSSQLFKPAISPTRTRALSPAASAAVEAQKAALKRQTLAARQGVELPEVQPSASGMKRSGRWFGRLSSAATSENAAQDETMSSLPARASTPPAVASASVDVVALRTHAESPATPPPPRATSVRGPAKKASYTALGRGRIVRAASPTPGFETQDAKEETSAGFASLQELLERNGYAETRVITPQAHKLRPALSAEPARVAQEPTLPFRASSPKPVPAPPAPSLEPDAQTQPKNGKGLKERSSLLSLRGWFSLFSPAPESDAGDDDEEEVEVLADCITPAATESPHPRMRSASEMQHWVEGVAEAYPPPPSALHPHPLSHSSLPVAPSSSSLEATPQLVQYHPQDDDDSASARSYSSSLSLDYSPPTPHHPLPLAHARSFCPTISISPDGDSPLRPRAGKSSGNSLVLRHAVSDSHLLTSPSFTAFPAYESFSGLGISVPSPSSSHAPSPPHTPQRVATPPPAPGMFSSMWVPSLLRERASQLFSHAASPATGSATSSRPPTPGAFASPFDAATGLSPSQRRLLTAAHAHVHGRAPKLLRKAVSAGGLRVAAQGRVTRARVEAKSSRESLGSLEAAPVPGDGEGAVVASAWGEDLLGRRW
ncbi:hypothetical protein JCM3770_006741 [Rhodotorula araucariae]